MPPDIWRRGINIKGQIITAYPTKGPSVFTLQLDINNPSSLGDWVSLE